MNKKKFNLADLENATTSADHTENNTTAVETKPETVMVIKTVEVDKEWTPIYKKLPQPKISFTAFCTQAIKEKLEREGIITKETT
jgi:hypothetical protein